MSQTTTTRTLADLRAEWDLPFLADPDDKAACAGRSRLTRELAAAILSAPLHEPGVRLVRTAVGAMRIARAGWSPGASERAEAAGAKPGSPEWFTALGPHDNATLTGDGGEANRRGWCQCGPDGGGDVPAQEWVRYEHWTADGCERHGFVHSQCRRLLQVG